MAQQTAVDWLQSKVLYIVPSSQKDDLLKLFEQAKQMEKEQMFGFTKKFHIVGKNSAEFYTEEFEKYYKETYGNEGV